LVVNPIPAIPKECKKKRFHIYSIRTNNNMNGCSCLTGFFIDLTSSLI
jgi:hypothetical protein